MIFLVLDIILMLLTFYAVKKSSDFGFRNFFRGSTKEKNIALTVSILAHALASLSTIANQMDNGCLVTLPILSAGLFGIMFFLATKVIPVWSKIESEEH